jgi:hypothetical protein
LGFFAASTEPRLTALKAQVLGQCLGRSDQFAAGFDAFGRQIWLDEVACVLRSDKHLHQETEHPTNPILEIDRQRRHIS